MAGTQEEALLLELLRRAKAGDRDALDEFLLKAHTVMLRFARSRLGGRAWQYAEDIAGESLVRVRRYYRSCEADSLPELYSWLLTVAHRERLRFVQSPGFRQNVALEAAAIERPEALVDRAESTGDSRDPGADILKALTLEAYEQLSDSTQQVVYCRLIEGSSWKDIALKFRTTETGAKRRFQRGQKRIRSMVGAKLEQLSQAEQVAVERFLA